MAINQVNKSKNFKEIFSKLNIEQQEAVLTINGPVMVVAGPGTGKTQLLAMRIWHILEFTDTMPEQILCLTFTDAATFAMKNRLIAFIGAKAFRVQIYTYHAFASKVLKENIYYNPILSEEPISKLESYEIINQLLNELDKNNFIVKSKNTDYVVKELLKLIEIIKKEKFEQKNIFALIDAYVDGLLSDPSFYYKRKHGNNEKGDLKKSDYDKAINEINGLKEALILSFNYINMLKKVGKYDFNDMLLWTIDLFKSNHHILLNYKDQIDYILVDEYQDTNTVQNELIFNLSGTNPETNLLVVGDEDQSIYKFQGADISNIISFKSIFGNHVKEIYLNKNYRSSQQILDFAKQIIDKNNERISEIPKYLESQKEKSSILPQIVELEDVNSEAVFIYKTIVELHKQGIPYQKIAIIYKEHKHVECIKNLFLQKNIPFILKQKINILNEQIIIKFIKIMEYFNHEIKKPNSGNHLLFEILHFNFFNLKPIDIAKFSLYFDSKKTFWREEMSKLDINNDQFNPNTIQQFKNIFEDIEYCIHQYFQNPIIHWIESVISRFGIFKHIVSENNKFKQLQSFSTFINFIKLHIKNHKKDKLEHILELISTYEKLNISLDKEDLVSENNAIMFTTYHSAKGLEFDTVFLIKSDSDNWKIKNDKLPFKLNKIYSNITELQGIEELRRLFYVGITRAETRLFITHYINNKNKKNELMPFLIEYPDTSLLEHITFNASKEEIEEVEISNMTFKPEYDFEKLNFEILKERTEQIVLTASIINEFIKCKRSFYYKYILKVPSENTVDLSFGNAIHNAIDRFLKQCVVDNYAKLLPIDLLLLYFEEQMVHNSENFIAIQFENYKKHGEKNLEKLYNYFKSNWHSFNNIASELSINNIEFNGIPIKGKLDMVFENEKRELIVFDFKTGALRNVKEKIKAPQDDNFDGSYWVQVMFYKLLIENNKQEQKTFNAGYIVHLEVEKDKNIEPIKINLMPNDEQSFKDKIISIYDEIKAQNFNEPCKNDNCNWCNFHKSIFKEN